MANRRVVYGSGDGTVNGSISDTILIQNKRVPCSSDPLDSAFLSRSSPSYLGSRSMVSFGNVNRGKRSMVSFEDVYGEKRSDASFFRLFDQEENIDDEYDEYFPQPEKKRRLTPGQIEFLERNFEVENKLEPERKIQLAKDIGLQPRQVAIWFQNRRARSKTNHLEKDYKALQASYNSLKADYDSILKEKEKLKAEVLHITENLLFTQKEEGNFELSDTKEQSQPPPEKPIAGSVSDDEVSKVSIVACNGVLDSDSLCFVDRFHSSRLERGDSSYVFEPDQSDLSQDEEDYFSRSLESPTASLFPNIEDADYPDLPANSCYFGFLIEDQSFGFWSF